MVKLQVERGRGREGTEERRRGVLILHDMGSVGIIFIVSDNTIVLG